MHSSVDKLNAKTQACGDFIFFIEGSPLIDCRYYHLLLERRRGVNLNYPEVSHPLPQLTRYFGLVRRSVTRRHAA